MEKSTVVSAIMNDTCALDPQLDAASAAPLITMSMMETLFVCGVVTWAVHIWRRGTGPQRPRIAATKEPSMWEKFSRKLTLRILVYLRISWNYIAWLLTTYIHTSPTDSPKKTSNDFHDI